MARAKKKFPFSVDATRAGGPNIFVLELSAHRNGVGGEGFFALRFRCEDGTYLGVMDYTGHTFVIDPLDLGQHFRGSDYYGPVIRQAIFAWYEGEYGVRAAKQDVPEVKGA